MIRRIMTISLIIIMKMSKVLIMIMLVGSLWIMFHLTENTHPQPTPAEARNLP